MGRLGSYILVEHILERMDDWQLGPGAVSKVAIPSSSPPRLVLFTINKINITIFVLLKYCPLRGRLDRFPHALIPYLGDDSCI